MDWWFLGRSVLVPIFLSGLVTFLMLGWVYENRMKPILEDAQRAIKTGMSAMGEKSGVVRNQKAFDEEMAGGFMEQYPELEAILEMLNPDLAEKVRDDPLLALNFVERYGHLLGIETGEGAKKKESFDY